MSYEWSYGDILNAVDEITPADRPALVHGDRIISHGAFAARSNNLARSLLQNGAVPGDKIAFYMRNLGRLLRRAAQSLLSKSRGRIGPRR